MATSQRQPQQRIPAAADFKLASQFPRRVSRAPACENCEICSDDVAPSASLLSFSPGPLESHYLAERPSSDACDEKVLPSSGSFAESADIAFASWLAPQPCNA